MRTIYLVSVKVKLLTVNTPPEVKFTPDVELVATYLLTPKVSSYTYPPTESIE